MGPNFPQPVHPEWAKPLGGRYQIMQQLGAGGFGQTFLARDLHLPEHPLCVVKQLKPQIQTPQEMQIARRLFDTEAKVLHRLGGHPQIPSLFAHFEENNEFYLAQELIEGRSLEDELITAVPWSDGQVVTLLGDILGVLTFVHSNQVIHRDLKPSNLIRRQRDNRIVLIDFGAVKQVSTQVSAAKSGISHTISIGTQGYMPNEQIAGRPQFSSDVYAVGMIAIQALTGQPPYTIPLHPQTGELEWHSFAPRTHPGLIALLDYMVRYDFRARYATAVQALSALQSLPLELSQFIPPLTYAYPAAGVQQAASAQQVVPPTNPQPSSPSLQQPLPPQPSPTMAVPTVAVGGRPHATEGIAAARRPGRTEAVGNTNVVSTPPKAQQSAPSRKMAVPVGIGAAVLLGLGLLTWRACTPTPTPENARTVPEETPVAESPVVEPETSPGAIVDPVEQPSQEAARAREAEPEPAAPSPEETPPPAEEAEPDPPEATAPEPQSEATPPALPPATSEPAAALTPSAAETTVASLYSHVSSQDWSSARASFGGSLAQQFDPNFFKQFQQVTVENLRVTNQTADSVELVGQNTYVYSDGRTQREERTYTVQMNNGQPRIVASSFVRVIKSRND
ncbi:MAG TPA: protein kinase [Trichocoleus sp.]